MNIDENIVVPCPLIGFALRKAMKCLKCGHYQGVAGPKDADDIIQLHIICGKPMTRRLQRIED